jgi:hypothetical protein
VGKKRFSTFTSSSWSPTSLCPDERAHTPVPFPTHSLVESGMSKNHEPRDFGCSSIRLLAPIGYYYEPKHDSERGGARRARNLPGEEREWTTREGGTAQCACACHEVSEHRHRPVRAPVLHAPKHDPREGGIRRGVNGSVV